MRVFYHGFTGESFCHTSHQSKLKMKTPEGQPDKFLLDASLLFKETCPELSRFFMQRPVNATSKTKSPGLSQTTLVCPYCYQWLQPDNHRIRLRPKKHPSARVQSVLRRKAQGKRLSVVQKILLHRFQISSSVLMATCHTCNRTSMHKGMSRDFIATLTKPHGTPGSTGKHKTPQSTSRPKMTPNTSGKEKTPVHTSRSSSSCNTSGSGSSSSKPPTKTRNWVVQRLSKILMREDNQGSKKGGLKDFLSSL